MSAWQTLITVSGGLAAAVAIVTLFARGVRWVDEQKDQRNDISELRETHNADISDLKQEQRLLVHGILACLKGLSEQGCNGPVTEAIKEIEEHLNNKAHQ